MRAAARWIALGAVILVWFATESILLLASLLISGPVWIVIILDCLIVSAIDAARTWHGRSHGPVEH